MNFIIDQWIKQIRSKNVYKDELDVIVNKYNSTYHRNIKTKPIDVKPSTYIVSGIKNNEKGPKFEVSDHVRRSKYKENFKKDYTPNWSEEDFVIKKV